MKKMGFFKRLLWCWETICYGCFFGVLLKLILVGEMDNWMVFLCSPTAIFMLTFGENIYNDKIKWENFKIAKLIGICLWFFCFAIYGIIRLNITVLSLALGVVITSVVFTFIAISEINKNKTKW